MCVSIYSSPFQCWLIHQKLYWSSWKVELGRGSVTEFFSCRNIFFFLNEKKKKHNNFIKKFLRSLFSLFFLTERNHHFYLENSRWTCVEVSRQLKRRSWSTFLKKQLKKMRLNQRPARVRTTMLICDETEPKTRSMIIVLSVIRTHDLFNDARFWLVESNGVSVDLVG